MFVSLFCESQGDLLAWRQKRVVKGMSEGNGGFSPKSEEVSLWFVFDAEEKGLWMTNRRTRRSVVVCWLVAGQVICEESVIDM